MGKYKKGIGIAAAFALIAAASLVIAGAQTSSAQGLGNMANKARGMMANFVNYKGKMGHATTGTVAAINGNSITLNGSNGTTYTVDAGNAKIMKVVNNAKTTIQVSGIATGDTLTVFGKVSGNNITATSITDGQMPAKQIPAPAATGTISAINGNIITLNGNNGTVYTVDASNTAIGVFKQGTSLQNFGIKTGDTVSVFGAVSGTNITATNIMDGNGMMGMHGFGQKFQQ